MSHMARNSKQLSALLPELDKEEMVWGENTTEAVADSDESDNQWHNPVYEWCESALWRKRLVLTPYMLLDRLKVCADLTREVQEEALSTEGVLNRVDRLADEVDRLLTLLWRSGLWTDMPTEEREACDGRRYRVLSEPFTDGKPHGKSLPPDMPTWVQELLGVSSALS